MSIIQNLLDLEKDDDRWLVYTYLIPDQPTGKAAAILIVLDIANSESKAKKKAEEIIRKTGHNDILTYPMGKWLTLGDPSFEKMTPVEIRDKLGEFAEKEETNIAKQKKERRAVEEEIKAEQKAIKDDSTIESYYYDWICAVQNKAVRDSYKESYDQADRVYRMRVERIRDKDSKYPEHKQKWKDTFIERLEKRGEGYEAKAIVNASEEIRQSELDL